MGKGIYFTDVHPDNSVETILKTCWGPNHGKSSWDIEHYIKLDLKLFRGTYGGAGPDGRRRYVITTTESAVFPEAKVSTRLASHRQLESELRRLLQ